MARSGLIVLSILAFAATQFNGAWGQGQSRAPEMMELSASGAPPPTTSNCQTELINNLIRCLDFVTNSSVTAPEADCCTGLATIVNSNPVCLCSLIGSNAGPDVGIDINKTRSIELPRACNVTTPDPSLCALFNGSPAPAPSMFAGGPVSPVYGSSAPAPSMFAGGPGGPAKEAKGSGVAASFKSCTGLLLTGLSVAIMAVF